MDSSFSCFRCPGRQGSSARIVAQGKGSSIDDQTVVMALPEDTPGKARSTKATGQARDDWDQAESRRLDCGPWIETPGSTRVRSFRYDFAQGNIHIQWRKGGPGHVYEDVPFETFKAFTKISSKGHGINSMLNGFSYRRITPEELNAPANNLRSVPGRTDF